MEPNCKQIDLVALIAVLGVKMLRVLGYVTAIFLAIVLVQPSVAQTMKDSKTCFDAKADPDEIIQACGVFIRTHRSVGGRVPLPTVALYGALASRGYAYVRKHDWDLAIDDFDKAIKLSPTVPDAYDMRSIAHFNRGDNDLALADYNKGIDLAQDKKLILAEIYANRGVFYTAKRDYQHALSDLDEAVRLDPKNANTHLLRAGIYALTGETERANTDYEKAIQLDPASRKRYEDDRDFNAHWIAYLKEIQDDDDYANWSGPPLDAFMRPLTQAGMKTPPSGSCDLAAMHWKSTESIATLAAYEDHLVRFPNCAFATLAKARIDALKK
jgi:tetratricopeptide (TPR) repeat protein